MKSSQRQYELGFNLIGSNPKLYKEDYFRSIDEIRSRPNRYIFPIQKMNNIRKNLYEPYKDLFVIEENKKLRFKIYSIESRPALPKINYDYLELKERRRNNREKINELYQKALTLENEKLTERIFCQRPRVVNPKWVEDLYEKSREKSREPKRRRDNDNNNDNYSSPLILPRISSHNNYGKKNKHARTDANNNSDNEKSNSVELNDHKHNEISHQRRGHIEG